MRAPILEKLTGGDRRSIGRANEVVDDVLHSPHLFETLLGGLHDDNPLIRMRAADALEKISVRHPEWLVPFKNTLLRHLAQPEMREVRWHLVQMAPRLPLTICERLKTITLLKSFLSDNSSILKTSAMQAIADLVGDDDQLRTETIHLLEKLIIVGSPAMKSRGRKLLKSLGAENPPSSKRAREAHGKRFALER
jgi:HEAT repeat protein